MFKPILASSVEDESQIRFPVLASRKLDGIRAMVQGGRLVSRTLKPIPNVNVQERFKGLAEGLDGELIYGDPFAEDAFRQTTSIVMSDDKPAGEVFYHVFDKFSDEGFITRLNNAALASVDNSYVSFVEHVAVDNIESLNALEVQWLQEGYEGVMLRDPHGRYKQGRSSVNEGLLLRIKRFVDFEAEVIGYFEQQENQNEATKDLLGHTQRSTMKAGKVNKGTLGGIEVMGLGGKWDKVTFRCGTGFKAEQRQELWNNKESLIGLIAKLKYQPIGSKDKPRLPVFLGWRDRRDM